MRRYRFMMALGLVLTALAVAGIACSSSKSTKTNATSTPKKTAVSTPVATRSSQTPQASTPRSTASSQTTPSDATLKVTQNASLGTIVTDAAGRTVYKYASDQAGTSNCAGTCAQNWPPVMASGQPTAGNGVTGQVGTIQRADGTTQLTLDGSPLYYFVSDTSPGAATGDGVGGFSVIKVGG